MERTLIAKILENTPGITKGDAGYEMANDHHASLYIGVDGAATVLADLVRIQLHDDHVQAEAKDRTLHAVAYAPIQIVSVRRPREKGDSPRTGF